MAEGVKQRVQPTDAEEAHGDDEQAGHRAAAHGDLQRFVETGTNRRGRAYIGADRNPHADITRDQRTGRAEHERERRPKSRFHGRHRVGLARRAHVGVEDKNQDRQDRGQNDDGAVLPRHESLGALFDGVRDVPHLLRAGVLAQHLARQVHRKSQRQTTNHYNKWNHDSSSSLETNLFNPFCAKHRPRRYSPRTTPTSAAPINFD